MLKIKKISRTYEESNPEYGTGIDITFVNQENAELCYFISSETLRKSCPCASCLQKKGDTTHERPLTGTKKSGKSSLLQVVSASSDEECNLVKIWALGNYAIGMKWADGHDTGIYTYQYLGELAKG